MFWIISTVVILFFTRVAAEQGSDVVKLFVTEGDDVILPCSPQPNMNIEAKLFDWKKDKKEVFLFNNGNYYGVGLSGQDEEFKGRVSHFVGELKLGNASILLRDTRTTDSGNYTCFFPHLGSGQTYRVELVVEMTFKNRLGLIKGVALRPYVKIRNVTRDGVLLECFVPGAYPQPELEWQTSDGTVVPAEEPHVSHRGHRFDVLLLTTVNKTNTYRCVLKQDGFGHVIDNELFVPDNLFKDKSCTSTSVALRPYVKIRNVTGDGVLLECFVPGAYPQPELEWQTSDGTVVPAEEPHVSRRGHLFDVLLLTTVNKTNTYRCVLKQDGFGHVIHNELFVPDNLFKDKSCTSTSVALRPYVKIRNVTGDGVLLECFVPGAYPQPELEWQTSDGTVVPAEEPHVSRRGHRFDVLLLITVNKTNTYRCVDKQDGLSNELFVPDNLFKDKSSTSTSVLMVVIITIFSTLVIALLGGFLVKTIMYKRKKLLERRSRGREAERDATQAEAGELESQLPYSDAEPDEAGAGAVAGHQLSNGS
ncbi:butyrophilin subfamily 2 member A2-like isoform X2 [Limanda limanda]|uniref:butyrophilin subfamily 2 member A2-like isoform X2 n=1 Tax=Limanda limanda TaxID=27771 RepID=UPI0029C924D2|nr:butyrophilin subfamily 2 member A2-like isoform X2 [Limanda limanda]